MQTNHQSSTPLDSPLPTEGQQREVLNNNQQDKSKAQEDEQEANACTSERHVSVSEGGQGHDEDDAQDRGLVVRADDMTAEHLGPTKKKKKKSRKPASKRGLEKPTGFEDNFADAPMTAEQHSELQDIYSADLPFVERILTAIQRFERTRKLDSERRDVFYKYLAYGGVEVGPNMFQGGQDIKEMDKDELSVALAQANISDSVKATIRDPKAQPSGEAQTLGTQPANRQAKYEVDFQLTMRAFLSRRAPTVFAFETQTWVDKVTTTLERFMDYLMQNEVCPEYNSEVLATRNLCRQARTELWHCAEAERLLPGDFNKACSTLFGGIYSRDYDGLTAWDDSRPGQTVFVGFTSEMASQIVGFAIAGAAGEDVYQRYHEILENIPHDTDSGFEVVNTIVDHGFVITGIEDASMECVKLYEQNTKEFRAVGKVYAKFWQNDRLPPDDLTATEKKILFDETGQSRLRPHEALNTEFTFFLEHSQILPLLHIGQKIEATLHLLNCGVWFFDEVVRVYPSFDAWIENELMLGWKEPKPLKGALDYVESDGADDDDENAEAENAS